MGFLVENTRTRFFYLCEYMRIVFPKHPDGFRSWFKGADTAAVARYLEWKYFQIQKDHPEASNQDYLHVIYQALVAGNEFLRKLYHAHLFMRRPETRHIAKHGRALLTFYTEAVQKAFGLGKARFKLAPKLHMFCHVIRVLEQSSVSSTWTLCPVAYSCQMDEDLVGRICTLSRTASSRCVHERTLRKYLVNVNVALKQEANKG